MRIFVPVVSMVVGAFFFFFFFIVMIAFLHLKTNIIAKFARNST